MSLVKQEEFKNKSFSDQLESLLPLDDTFQGRLDVGEQVSLPSFNKRKKAAQDAYEELNNRWKPTSTANQMKEKNASSDYDSEASSGGGIPVPPQMKNKSRADDCKPFLDALPFCHPIILGFHVIVKTKDSDKCCICPCSGKMSTWRAIFNINDLRSSEQCSKGKFYEPNGFIDHLNSKAKQGNELSKNQHEATLCYLKKLYSNYREDGLMHKAFYPRSDDNYRKALALETQEDQLVLMGLKEVLARARKENNEISKENQRLKVLAKTSPDLAEAQKTVEELRKKISGMLELSKTTKGSALTKNQIKECLERHESNTELWKIKLLHAGHTGVVLEELSQALYDSTFSTPQKKPNGMQSPTTQKPQLQKSVVSSRLKQKEITLHIKEGFNLKEFFETWWNLNSEKDNTFLFREDIDESNGYRFSEPLYVHIEGSTKWYDGQSPKSKKAKIEIKKTAMDMAPIDEGGPTRSFVSDVWAPLGDLTLSNGSALFDPGTFLSLQIDAKIVADDLKRARAWYTAVGRIMSLCLIHGFHVADHVFPTLYRNYFFRDLSPLDEEYPLSDLVNDVCEFMDAARAGSLSSKMETFLSGGDDNRENHPEDTEEQKFSRLEKRFRTFINEQFFEQKTIAISSLRKGLGLGVCTYSKERLLVPASSFKTMHAGAEAVSEIIFAKPTITAKDVIRVLKSQLEADKKKHFDIRHRGSQLKVLKFKDGENTGILVDLIEERANDHENYGVEWLREFVAFTTGYKYVPRTNFTISVEFNADETKEDSLPVAHTCTMELKFPWQAYNGNIHTLKKKLDRAMEETQGGRYSME